MAASLLFSGCASTGKANLGKPIDPETHAENGTFKPGVAISCELSDALSSEYFGYLDFNIANPSGEWKIVTDVKIRFADPGLDSAVSVVLGRNLEAWYQAQSKAIDISQHNQDVALGLLGGAGLGIAAFSRNEGLGFAGAAAAAGAASALAIRGVGRTLDSLQMAKLIPRNHLLADTIAVPPGLFADRWLLLNSTNQDSLGYITDILIDYKVNGGKAETQRIRFRKEGSVASNKWQHAIHGRKARSGQSTNLYRKIVSNP